ncbi:hypothetical protein AB0P21_37255 [Kribbella sp. NPDC056861]|uniref:hypothetical protein n=1 Tax=Kribbella sp. NPDC056861 TaxID=3154857 RepID=UPI00343AFA6C
MSIDESWREIERLLPPRIAATLRPPASEESLQAWAETVGSLPQPLVELYSGHEGTDHAGGSKAFCFVGAWYPLPIESAIRYYHQVLLLTDLYNTAPLIPFAIGIDGSLLSVSPDGSAPVQIVYTDGPGGVHLPSIESLVQRTVAGLRDEDPEYRLEITPDNLLWVHREYEAEHLGRGRCR